MTPSDRLRERLDRAFVRRRDYDGEEWINLDEFAALSTPPPSLDTDELARRMEAWLAQHPEQYAALPTTPTPPDLECWTCHGQGWVAETTADPLPSGEPGEPYQVQETCPDCGGAGSLPTSRARPCGRRRDGDRLVWWPDAVEQVCARTENAWCATHGRTYLDTAERCRAFPSTTPLPVSDDDADTGRAAAIATTPTPSLDRIAREIVSHVDGAHDNNGICLINDHLSALRAALAYTEPSE